MVRSWGMKNVSESPHKGRDEFVRERKNRDSVCARVCARECKCERTVYRISEGVFDRNARWASPLLSLLNRNSVADKQGRPGEGGELSEPAQRFNTTATLSWLQLQAVLHCTCCGGITTGITHVRNVLSCLPKKLWIVINMSCKYVNSHLKKKLWTEWTQQKTERWGNPTFLFVLSVVITYSKNLKFYS